VSRARGRPATPTTALVPAAARGDAALADVEAVLNSDAIEVFAKAVGGRAQLADTLAVAGTSSEIERITTLLLDLRYRDWSLARLCQVVGITVADLFASYRKALIARAHIESSHIIAGKLPGVVTDVMDKALPAPMLCPMCHGERTVPASEPGQAPIPCRLCAGTGTVLSEPTVERHKLALEVGQLLEKKGGLLVQQNTIAASLSATAPGALEQLQQAVGDLLFGDRRSVVEREPERDDPPAELPDEVGEEEPELPFGDPRDPRLPRRPDLPGEPEPS
jgi:hypothetical protein